MVNGIGSAFLTGAASKSGAEASKSLFENNSETYLNLFLTQLKNQDPLNSMEVKDMTQQLSQLNSSQQLIDVNSNLETLIAANSTSQAASIANFINKDVKYLSNQVYSDGQTPNEISYILDKPYESTTIEIRDSSGRLINTTEGETTVGNHSIFWDGTNAEGEKAPNGLYNITVLGENESGLADELKTLVSGTVTGVDFTNSIEPVVTVGYGDAKVDIDLKNIAAVNDLRNTSITTN